MKSRFLPIFLVAVWGSLPLHLPQTQEASLANLTRASHIIFVGRVAKLHATNLKVVAPSETTVLVMVEELLDSPPAFAGLNGREVAVAFMQVGEVEPEQRAVFFTNGILLGEHLEVKEVGLLPVPADLARLRAEIAALRAQMSDDALKERLTGAVLVVAGKVLETRPLKRATPASEHAPDWSEAIIRVEKVEKGTFRGAQVTVYFPRSTDERWMLSPKFHPGQQGIWILHREAELGVPQAGFTALSPSDYHALAEQRRIRELLR